MSSVNGIEILAGQIGVPPDQMYALLGGLTSREREILELRFGLLDVSRRTLEEVAGQLRMTRERVRMIEVKAIKKLRGRVANR